MIDAAYLRETAERLIEIAKAHGEHDFPEGVDYSAEYLHNQACELDRVVDTLADDLKRCIPGPPWSSWTDAAASLHALGYRKS